MASEGDTSSWHPASMPNSLQDPRTSQGQSTTESASAVELSESPAHDPAHTSEPQEVLHSEDVHEATDASFSNDEDVHGGAGLSAEEVGTSHYSVAENELQATETEYVIPASDLPAHKPTAQHSSSMSFARTVSHEVSFHDDDDADWSLQRTDTDPDPFQFMAPSDRTNSFPVVPLMAADSEHHDETTLQSNQALDVLEETERDYDAEEEEYQTGAHQETGLNTDEKPETSGHRRTHSRSIGGEVPWSEAVASEARFEEGVPLIPHPSDSPDHEDGGVRSGFATSFDDDDNDDFFGQPQATRNHDTNDGDEIQPLQRKSTMQVLAAIDSAPPSQQDTLEETPEEDEERAGGPAEDTSNQNGAPVKEDLASKWQEAFADGDDDADFLLEDSTIENKDVDVAAFLGSDDEGLLDELLDEDEPALTPQPTTTTSQPQTIPGQGYGTNSYIPVQQQTSAYSPITSQVTQNPYSAFGQTPPTGLAPQYGQVPPPRPEPSKAQSFADKSKGGYSSPYDLPMDLVANTVKPRKRASMQQLSHESSAQPVPPPRSASMHMTAPPPPPAVQAAHQKPPAPAARTKENFFEDLPIITTKLRPSSRQSHRAPSPSVYAPPGPSPLSPHTATQTSNVLGPSAFPATTAPPGIPNLVAPERMNPYATLQTSIPPVPPPTGNVARYSPAPAQTVSAPPVVTSRYSPAPPASRPPAYNPAIPAAVSQPILPHLPRTSSPLAHFEMSSEKAHAAGHGPNGEAAHPERRASSSYESRITRVPSLPPTREVEEEEDDDSTPSSRKESLTQSPPPHAATSRYSPIPTAAARRTPPPIASMQSMLSPPKRPGSSYAPHAPPAAQPGFVPPPRAQTQSPGATRGGRHMAKTSDPGRRPVSSHSPTSPVVVKPTTAAHTHSRPPSLSMNMVAPTDGREQDPLQRWQGVPIVSWGVGGTIVTTFPKSIPRYVMNQTTPSMLRTAGEVKVRNIKDIEPLHDRLSKFPGPLKGKSKKKEVVTWLSSGIDSLEKELPDVSFHAQLSTEAKRAIERLLLWKVLRVFVEFDGVLEGTAAVESAVRDILSQGAASDVANGTMFPSEPGFGVQSTTTSMQTDGVDASTMEQIRRDLLKGDRETAVWAAVDKRLWGHAMLISQTVSPDLYKRVAQEFVRKEVNHPGHSNESLAALYKIFSGNFDDCVDELVPVHARAGLQLVSTESSSGPTRDAADGLDRWRETLTLVLSNRSSDDIRGLNALGKLLSSYGRAEAAHICFIFSRNISVFGGIDDPNVDYVLLGSDHRQSSLQFAQDTEALQLSEVYEYGLSLSGLPSAAAGAPHLAAYKLHHAITLAEYGHRDKALQYCDAIATAVSAQTRRSPYHHTMLESAVDDLMRRLKQAPKEESSSWMSKPSMNKVSDSMWNRFNKFVAGDEQDANGNAVEADTGPFARIGTPTISRSPSVSNFESFGVTSPGYPTASAPIATSTSRYAPQAGGIPNSFDSGSPYLPSSLPQAGRNSNEYSSSPYEPSYMGVGSPVSPTSGGVSSNFGFQPLDAGVSLNAEPATQPNTGGYQPFGYQDSNAQPAQPNASQEGTGAPTQGYQPTTTSYGYEPPQMTTGAASIETTEKENGGASVGYEPPSFQPYGYEPPSYEPNADASAENDDDAPKPKKKSFMDDDEDDIPSLKPQEKSKAEKDRENDELFRKAAEEDAKRAAAQQAGKKGWGFTGWFGGAKKEAPSPGEASPGKPIKAKLGEASSFVYDPDLKRWINKKAGAENVEAKGVTPPPPRGAPRSVSGTPPPRAFTPPPSVGRASVPPPSTGGLLAPPTLNRAPSQESLGGAPPMMRSMSGASVGGPPSRPPSRPTTSMSNASSIDDLLSTSAPRKAGQKKPRKSGRYVDVMAK
ncbi:COPII coat assembly protein sec16 [Cladobotryum mycophilum]|uniref:Protein transport protein sec16 n=1 Tax=Cladobotryum mycophilum TaxID=491253 RepID=A0ABR0SP25_9HYPO